MMEGMILAKSVVGVAKLYSFKASPLPPLLSTILPKRRRKREEERKLRRSGFSLPPLLSTILPKRRRKREEERKLRRSGFSGMANPSPCSSSPPRTAQLAFFNCITTEVEDEKEEEKEKEEKGGPCLDAYMHHVRCCNRSRDKRSEFIPFIVENKAVGFIHPSFLEHLKRFPEVFVNVEANKTQQEWNIGVNNPCNSNCYITMHSSLKTAKEKTVIVNEALSILKQEGFIPGWRNEFYPVVETFGNSSLFSLERAAVPYFGTKAYGVHMNGYVLNAKGEKFLWVAKRSKTKQTYPSMLDHLVAGGQAEGLTCKENLIKECDEEANIPRFLAERAVAVGAVSYEDINENRFKRDVLFCYDLQLPPDFKPENKDKEVESFSLLPIDDVVQILNETRLYKPNCALVVIDFLFRHGYITPEQKGYLSLLQSLQKGECL